MNDVWPCSAALRLKPLNELLGARKPVIQRSTEMAKPKEITPAEAAELLRDGATLVDIREAPERASGVIPGAAHAPLSLLPIRDLDVPPGRPVIFHCKAGGRTGQNAPLLSQKAGPCEVYLLSGGIDAWRAAGLPLERPG